MSKVAVGFKPQFFAAKDLALARGGEIVFSVADPRDIPDGVEKPSPLAAKQFRFSGLATCRLIRLTVAEDERHDVLPAIQGGAEKCRSPRVYRSMVAR